MGVRENLALLMQLAQGGQRRSEAAAVQGRADQAQLNFEAGQPQRNATLQSTLLGNETKQRNLDNLDVLSEINQPRQPGPLTIDPLSGDTFQGPSDTQRFLEQSQLLRQQQGLSKETINEQIGDEALGIFGGQGVSQDTLLQFQLVDAGVMDRSTLTPQQLEIKTRQERNQRLGAMNEREENPTERGEREKGEFDAARGGKVRAAIQQVEEEPIPEGEGLMDVIRRTVDPREQRDVATFYGLDKVFDREELIRAELNARPETLFSADDERYMVNLRRDEDDLEEVLKADNPTDVTHVRVTPEMRRQMIRDFREQAERDFGVGFIRSFTGIGLPDPLKLAVQEYEAQFTLFEQRPGQTKVGQEAEAVQMWWAPKPGALQRKTEELVLNRLEQTRMIKAAKHRFKVARRTADFELGNAPVGGDVDIGGGLTTGFDIAEPGDTPLSDEELEELIELRSRQGGP